MKYRSVICAIAKNENNYINEWVNWHIGIGFDHIYLFDNNDSSSEFVGNFIENIDKVTIFDERDRKHDDLQKRCYNEFYHNNSEDFEWCMFCDIDEFLFGIENINSFLSDKKFDDFDQIRICWRTFSDGGLIDRDIKVPVVDSFKEISKNNNLQRISKFIIRGGIESVDVGVHRSVLIDKKSNAKINLRTCLPSGTEYVSDKLMNEFINIDYSKETVFINHYRTKTLREFIDQKLNRGDVLFSNRSIDFDYYWITNEKTEEKEKFINRYLNRDL